jgi:hypothetical protein
MSSVMSKSSIASALPASTQPSSYQFQLTSLSGHLKAATDAYNAVQSPQNRTILNELAAHLKTLQLNNKDNGASEDTVSFSVNLLANATEALKKPSVKGATQSTNNIGFVPYIPHTPVKALQIPKSGNAVIDTITGGTNKIYSGVIAFGNGLSQGMNAVANTPAAIVNSGITTARKTVDFVTTRNKQGKTKLQRTIENPISAYISFAKSDFNRIVREKKQSDAQYAQDVKDNGRINTFVTGVGAFIAPYALGGKAIAGKSSTPKIKPAPAKTQNLLAPAKVPAVEIPNSSVTPQAVWEQQAGAGRPITPATKPALTLKPAPQVDFSNHPLSYADYNLKGFQAGDAIYKTPKGLKYARETIATAKKAIQSGDFGPFTAKQANDIVARLEGQLRKAKLGSLVAQKAKTTPKLKAHVKAKQQQTAKIKAERERALVQESLRNQELNAEWGVPTGSTHGYPRQYNMTEPFDAPEHGASHSNTSHANTSHANNHGTEPQLQRQPEPTQNVNTRFYADLEPEIPIALTPELKAAEALANIKAGATPQVREELAIKAVAEVSTPAELHALKVALFSHPVTQNILNVFEFGIAFLKKDGTFAKPIQPSTKTAVPLDAIVEECKALQLDFETQETPSHPALVNRAAAFLLNLQTDAAINAFVAKLGKKGGTREYIAKSRSFKQKVIERRRALKPADNQNLPISTKPSWVGHDGEIRDAHDRHDNATYLGLSPDPFQDEHSTPVKPKNALKSDIENARNRGATSSLPKSVTDARDDGRRFISAEPFGSNDPAGISDYSGSYIAPRPWLTSSIKPNLDGTLPSATPIKHVYYAPAWEGVLPPNQKPIFGSTGLSLGVMEIFATPTYNTIDTQGAKLSTPVVATMETLSDHINGAEDLSRAGHTTIHHSGISVNPKDVNAASPAKDANGLLIENITFGLLNALLSTGKIDSILTKLPSNLQGHARNVIEDLEARTKFDTKIGSINTDVEAYMQDLEAAGLGSVIDTGFAKKYISNTHTGSVGNAQTHSQNFIELFKSDPLVREELIHNLTESVRFTAQAEYNRQHNLPISREKFKIHVSPHTMRKLLQTSIKGLRELALAYPKAPSIKALADLYQTILGDETSQVAPARILTAAEQLTIDTHLKSKVGNRTSRYWNKYNGILAHWCAKKNVSLMHFVGDPIKPEANPTFGFHSVNGATKYMKENGETVDASDFDVYMNGLVAPLPTSPEPKPKKTRNSTGVTAGSGKTKKTQKALENKEGKQDLVKTNDAIVPKAAKQDKVASPEHKQPILLSQEHSEIRGWRYNQEILVARTESEKTKLTDEYTRKIYSRINKLSSDTFIYRHFNIEGRGVIETQSTGRINKNNVYYASAQEAKYNDFRRIELSLNRSGESFLSPTLIVAQHNLDEAKALLHMALSTYNIQSSDFTKLNRKISRQDSATATVLRNNMKAAFANPVQFMSKHSNDMTIDETNDQKITIENNRIADFNKRTALINQQTATYREARLTAKTEFIALGGKVLDKNGLGTQRAEEGLARDKQDSSIPLYTGKELDEAKAIVAEARKINYAASARLGKQRAFFYDDIKKISQLDESKAKQLRAGVESQIVGIANGLLPIQNAP